MRRNWSICLSSSLDSPRWLWRTLLQRTSRLLCSEAAYRVLQHYAYTVSLSSAKQCYDAVSRGMHMSADGVPSFLRAASCAARSRICRFTAIGSNRGLPATWALQLWTHSFEGAHSGAAGKPWNLRRVTLWKLTLDDAPPSEHALFCELASVAELRHGQCAGSPW